MLDSKYTDAYNSVCAPKDMLDKILNADKPVRRSFNYAKFTSIAACILLIVLMLPLYAGFTQPSVTISDTPSLAASRSTDTQIPLVLDLSRKTSVTVSEGELTGLEAETVKGELSLIWSFDSSDTAEPVLTLKDIFGTKVYRLCYNANNGSWSIVKK